VCQDCRSMNRHGVSQVAPATNFDLNYQVTEKHTLKNPNDNLMGAINYSLTLKIVIGHFVRTTFPARSSRSTVISPTSHVVILLAFP